MGAGAPHQRGAEFEEVALPHLDAMFNMAFNLTRNRKDAEDLVQEAYLRAYRFFDSYKSGTHIKAWLFRILRNTFINRYRATRARPDEVDFSKVESTYESVIDQDYVREQQPESPEERVMAGVLDEQVAEALGAVPEDYRTVVIMALVEGMSYKDIAAALEIPIGTVMSRLHRGRKLLQSELFEYAASRGIIKRPSRVPSDGVDASEG